VAVTRHLADGDEYTLPAHQLFAHGKLLFEAMWTGQEGGGRPLTKGTGAPLADPGSRLDFPRNFNRVSAPDANSCAGCHNVPRSGGSGDIVANVFVLGQRFDDVTFDSTDLIPTRGAIDEQGKIPRLDQVANSRATTDMFGGGYLEMLAREITFDLQAQGLGLDPGESVELRSKGISFGTLRRNADGSWDASEVEGLPQYSSFSCNPDGGIDLLGARGLARLGRVAAHLALDGSGVLAPSAGLAPDFEDLREEELMEERALLRGEKNRR
jgi:hypothetical protein